MPEPKPPRAIDLHARAVRDHFLEPPLSSAWPPLRIEGLTDALASKMTALVSRGAPRDMLDIFMAYREQLASVDLLWELWRARNPGQDVEGARAQIRHHLASLEARRPLASVPVNGQEQAGAVRTWLRDQLAATNPEPDSDR